MSGHKFGSIQGPADNPNMQYRQCQNCRKVMFINGDDYFNLICRNNPNTMEREKLRSKLEKEIF